MKALCAPTLYCQCGSPLDYLPFGAQCLWPSLAILRHSRDYTVGRGCPHTGRLFTLKFETTELEPYEPQPADHPPPAD